MVDVVIQGGWWHNILDNAEGYLDLDFVDRVIISTWEDAPVTQDDVANIDDERIVLIKNKYPEYAGPGNLNLHLKSALVGIDATDTEIIVKLRSDQKIFDYSFQKLFDFYEKHKDEPTIEYLDGTKQKSKIFITGNGTRWSYHPQDHIFWGHKSDVRRVFDIPPCNDPPWSPPPIDFTSRTGNIRGPIYIGAHYYAQFFSEARTHLELREKYLLDDAPDFRVALEFYLSNKETIFKPFPKIDLWWEKYNMGYKYDLYEPQGEYYSDDDV